MAKGKHAAEKPGRKERIKKEEKFEKVEDVRQLNKEEKTVENSKDYNKNTNSKGGRKIGKVIFMLLLVMVAIIAILIVLYDMALKGTGSESEKVTFDIPMGSGTDSIATILEKNDLIRNKEVFKIYVKLNNISNFKAGTYTITKDMDVKQITEALQGGIVFKDSDFKITFVEGKTLPYIAETIAKYTNNTEQDVYDLINDTAYINSLINEYWFITDEIKNDNLYYPLEGYLFPDTYSFSTADVTVKEIFKVMLDQMEKVLNNYREEIQTSGYTVHDILSMSSIIENEAIHDSDRKDVSSVMYNRLAAKMSLGSDVTTYYAWRIELGERDLYGSEITTYNPYNTRGPNMEGKLPVRTYFISRKSLN